MYVYTHICIYAYTYICISVYMWLLCLYLLYLLITNRQTHYPICQRCQKTKHRHATTIKCTPNIVMSHMRTTPSSLLRLLHIPQTPLEVTVVLEVKRKKPAMSKHQFASLNTTDPFHLTCKGTSTPSACDFAEAVWHLRRDTLREPLPK